MNGFAVEWKLVGTVCTGNSGESYQKGLEGELEDVHGKIERISVEQCSKKLRHRKKYCIRSNASTYENISVSYNLI